jgi:hypothetical protein
VNEILSNERRFEQRTSAIKISKWPQRDWKKYDDIVQPGDRKIVTIYQEEWHQEDERNQQAHAPKDAARLGHTRAKKEQTE